MIEFFKDKFIEISTSRKSNPPSLFPHPFMKSSANFFEIFIRGAFLPLSDWIGKFGPQPCLEEVSSSLPSSPNINRRCLQASLASAFSMASGILGQKRLKMAILREGETGKGIIIPVRIKSGGQIPEEIGTKAYADLSTKNRWNRNLPRLIEAITR